jgi:hypothetical protein
VEALQQGNRCVDLRLEADHSAVQRIQRPCSHGQSRNPRQASLKVFGNYIHNYEYSEGMADGLILSTKHGTVMV